MVARKLDKKLTFLTWNIWRINNPKKGKQILAFLDRHRIDVALLQETHFLPQGPSTYALRWGSRRYFASYSSCARDVS